MNRDFKGIWMPAELWLNPSLLPTEKMMLAEIDSLSTKERGCYANNKHFAESMNLKLGTVANMISDLRKRGFITDYVFDPMTGKREMRAVYSVEVVYGDIEGELQGVHPQVKGGSPTGEWGVHPQVNNKEKVKENVNKLKVVSLETTLIQEPTALQKRLNCKNGKHEQAVIEIVDYFNQVTGRKAEYQTKGALKYILHWLNEGRKVEDFKIVIDYKTKEFKGTENEKYIALDTYCRFDKFEDTLSKAKNAATISQDPSLNDCELTPEQQASYNETKSYILSHYPNLKDIRFFSHREFLQVSTNNTTDFLPALWRNKATVRNMQQMKKSILDKLNTNHFERKAAGSLYDYLKTSIRAELKKDN